MPGDRYRIFAGPGSPYSHKVRAVMRYRRIPHDWVIVLGGFDGSGQMGAIGEFKKRLLPIVQFPNGEAWNDSTPIIHDLEDRWPGRGVVPPTPRDRFLARIIEDFADEWLAVILMAFRWTSDEDVAFCARRQMQGWQGAVSEAVLSEAVARFTARQQLVRSVIGAGDVQTHGQLRREYEAMLDVLEAGMAERLFLFGDRPSIADFGLYGMLTQLAIDPTPQAVMRERAVRLYQWIQYVDDLSGHEGETWAEPGATVEALVRLAGRSMVPMMAATAAAYDARSNQARYDVGGVTLTSIARPYTRNCWLWLKQMWAGLSDTDREALTPLLAEAGFLPALAFRPGEAKSVPPFQMF
ncbi:MAG TPA: glutathione S-transferase family protein [Caulobacteraceae bacterium]|nr:glutathione S-transferase family protein [Caulobacteraceae bacterium]